jgi:uncharacterized tellurite resistance protein B-like protein
MDAKRRLKGMLARIFSDAEAEESERAELKAYLASGALSADEIKEAVGEFVEQTWKITLADGVVTDVEKKRLRAIANVLGLDRSALPPDWAKALD